METPEKFGALQVQLPDVYCGRATIVDVPAAPNAMSVEIDVLPARSRIESRVAAHWFHDEIKRMVAQGKTAAEISERLAALVYVWQDWKEQQIEMPNSKTPWDWDQADLERFILRRKTEW